MALPNVFTANVANDLVNRIGLLTPDSKALWGSMDVAQMLAHCNVTYEMLYDNIHPKPGFLVKLMLKTFVKSKVVNEAPYEPNGRTAPQFIIKSSKDFAKEKARLTSYIQKTQQLGEQEFEGKESHSFGKLSATEWNNMFYKHLNHHLSQFGV